MGPMGEAPLRDFYKEPGVKGFGHSLAGKTHKHEFMLISSYYFKDHTEEMHKLHRYHGIPAPP